MGYTIDAWIEYDAGADCGPRKAASKPPFSKIHDNCISLEGFIGFRYSKDYRFFTAISGIQRRETDPDPLISIRGGLPPNVSGYTSRHVFEITEENNPNLSWLTYPEIEQALAHMKVHRENLSLETNLVLDFMQSIEKRLGAGRSRLIFYISY